MLNQAFNELNLEKHPDKTLIGRTERGFDYLGYFLKPDELTVYDKTVKRFAKRIVRLYEQGADSVRIGQYVLKWLKWLYQFCPFTQYSTKVCVWCAGIRNLMNYLNKSQFVSKNTALK